MNAPDRYERFVVPEGTKKVSYERDTKIINAASFTIEREDHTIGNIVRMQLHRDENVLFAGYQLPHPLKYKIIVRIHTTSQSSPMQAYNQAINDLDKELDFLKSQFELEELLTTIEFHFIHFPCALSGRGCQVLESVLTTRHKELRVLHWHLEKPLPTITSPYSPSSDLTAVNVSQEFVKCFLLPQLYIFRRTLQTLVIKLHFLLFLYRKRSVSRCCCVLCVRRALVFQETCFTFNFTSGSKASASRSSLLPMNTIAMSKDALGLHASSLCPNDLSVIVTESLL
ncbi:hypothetical protein HID58_035222 [Brassica napus]|uniref:DNA-directed RNA polymerase RBP11-like dimerisation domain-containing protein n=1 Tax=Brassica napus TaxID=3708 RepID=A0ABQ8C6D6_BRANA|nr:hypothetical protein HID58_035222 [Brassica napus]